MSGSSWVSSPPCHNVLCSSAVWGSEGYDCAYRFYRVLSFVFMQEWNQNKAQRHSPLKHIQTGFGVPVVTCWNSSKALTVKKSTICVLNVYPLVAKRHIAQSCAEYQWPDQILNLVENKQTNKKKLQQEKEKLFKTKPYMLARMQFVCLTYMWVSRYVNHPTTTCSREAVRWFSINLWFGCLCQAVKAANSAYRPCYRQSRDVHWTC